METTRTVNFVYAYKDHAGKDCEAKLDVKFPFEDESLEELVTQLLAQMDPMMRYLDEDVNLEKKLQAFIDIEHQKFLDDYAEKLINQAANEELDLEAIVRNTERLYKEELLQFADRVGPSDEDIFAQSFHRLVHSTSLEDILKRERGYAKVIADMTELMDNEVESLNNSQQQEMDSQINQLDITTTSEDINNLLAQQYTTQNFVRKRYESELEAMMGHQKNEYRNWITSQVSQMFQVSPVSTPLGNRSSMFVSQQPSMEESFTIHLGSQLKHMHNIRILSANVTDLCSPLHAEESLNGLNMALGLYSSSLCGVVVLTPSIQAQANKSIIKNANRSTEFHFDQMDVQLEKIEKQIRALNSSDTSSTRSNGSGNSGEGSANSSPAKQSVPKLKTGDFFITKHSNLSQSHVIFHLISDEPINSPSEINSRHPVILGLRNILKTASRHDITTLTIPALLRHEMSEDMTVQWCIRRAELVFKCAKGFMIESASWGGAELSTLQLLLPHDISEELFTTLAGMVPNVFRVANPKILVDNNK
ncbi:protein C12orf4 homolog [Drosophila sulfurigaster albostrigata]|uniref:Protein C12orf4 homolog n=1 Tax=Drosophila albomicans TaxID=7291 RepID=A0A6P8XI76_DROAB|nr:protein C12orf4 homolog [Drosophila albomicans]XP_060649142.1 protein C12orf4 homolog [Drosophila nasuta]XP_062121592.1 protein C12orf4 homolog [Drosophila sulfurigaster albostrigata]